MKDKTKKFIYIKDKVQKKSKFIKFLIKYLHINEYHGDSHIIIEIYKINNICFGINIQPMLSIYSFHFGLISITFAIEFKKKNLIRIFTQ